MRSIPHPRPAVVKSLAAMTVVVGVTAGVVGVANALGTTTVRVTHEAAPSAPAAAPTPTDTPPVLAQRAAVRPLHKLHAPDAVVVLRHAASKHAVRRFMNIPGIHAVSVLDRGHAKVAGHKLLVVGVDPSRARGFTPSLTAKSDPLWQSVARGEVTVSYGESHGLRHRLGRDVRVAPGRGHGMQLRVGAFASVGIGSAQALVNRPVSRLLHLRPARELVVAAPHLTDDAIAAAVHRRFGAHALVHSTRPETTTVFAMSDYARTTIPPTYLKLYQAAATTCPGLPWTVLAGIGAVETGHGTNVHRSTKGAVGPMQFLPSTFAVYGIDGDGDGVADVQNPADAVYSAARYLCLWGAGRGGQALYDAVFAYNHADWYVRMVFNLANAYA